MDLAKQLKDLDLVLETSLLTHYADEQYSRHFASIPCGMRDWYSLRSRVSSQSIKTQEEYDRILDMRYWHSLRAMLEVFTTSKLRDYGPISQQIIDALS
jgi:hypothetical protein